MTLPYMCYGVCPGMYSLWRVKPAQPHHMRFTASISPQIRYVPILLLYRQKEGFTSWVLLSGTVSSWGCAASPLRCSETGTVPTTACVSCGLCLSARLGKSGRVPGWHGHMAPDQGLSSITAIRYFCWAAQTSLQYVTYLPLLLARCLEQTGVIIPVCWSVGHQCD